MRRYLTYLSYVVRHKWYVFNAARALEIPLLGLLHDASKLSPSEFVPYAQHFYNADGTTRTYKAHDGFYQDIDDDVAFDWAWLTHIKRNKHHPQHWIEVVHFVCACYTLHQTLPSPRQDVLIEDDGTTRCLSCRTRKRTQDAVSNRELTLDPNVMPVQYVYEMIADWVGAGAAQGTPDTLAWYHARGRFHVFHPITQAIIEDLLDYNAWAATQPT